MACRDVAHSMDAPGPVLARRINATLEKKLAREVQDLQSREDRAVLAEAALEERRARAQERIESMR